LHGRAGLALTLRHTIELAQRIRKAAGHRQDAAGFVLEHQCGALHGRANTQLRLSPSLSPALAVALDRAVRLAPRFGAFKPAIFHDVDIDHVVEPEAAAHRGAPDGERQNASVRQADADAAVAFLAVAFA